MTTVPDLRSLDDAALLEYLQDLEFQQTVTDALVLRATQERSRRSKIVRDKRLEVIAERVAQNLNQH